jgi:hypothetical protein
MSKMTIEKLTKKLEHLEEEKRHGNYLLGRLESLSIILKDVENKIGVLEYRLGSLDYKEPWHEYQKFKEKLYKEN